MTAAQAHQAWLAAERGLQSRASVDRAASTLPDRLGWLLRAMHALEDGRRAQIEAIAAEAEAAGHPDIAAILTLLLAPPDQLDPTKLRAAAKRAGLDRLSGLPFLDLLRATAVARAGGTPTVSPDLRQASPRRPALEAAVHSLTRHAVYTDPFPRLDALLPRASQVATAKLLLAADHTVSEYMVGLVAGDCTLRFPAKTWPDLRRPEEERDLEEALDEKAPWPRSDAAQRSWIGALPSAERRLWLGRVIRYANAQVELARWDAAAAAFETALCFTEPEPGLADLAAQLRSLGDRLDWLKRPSVPPEPLLDALWRGRAAKLSLEDRLRLAKMLASTSMDRVSTQVSREALVLLALHEQDGRRLPNRLGRLDSVSAPNLERLIRAAGPGPRSLHLLLGLHAAMVGSDGLAVQEARRLAEAGAVEDAAAVVRCTLRDPGHRLSRQAGRGLLPVLEALAATPASTERAWALALALPHLQPAPASVLAAAERFWGQPDPDVEARAAGFVLAWRARREDAARALVLEEGRTLRRAPDAARRAAGVLACALSALRVSCGDPVFDLLEPLSRFLLHKGGEAALAAVRTYNDDPFAVPGLLLWFLQTQDQLRPQEDWLDWLAEAVSHASDHVPKESMAQVRQLFKGALRAVLKTRPQRIEDLLVGMMQTQLQGRGGVPF